VARARLPAVRRSVVLVVDRSAPLSIHRQCRAIARRLPTLAGHEPLHRSPVIESTLGAPLRTLRFALVVALIFTLLNFALTSNSPSWQTEVGWWKAGSTSLVFALCISFTIELLFLATPPPVRCPTHALVDRPRSATSTSGAFRCSAWRSACPRRAC